MRTRWVAMPVVGFGSRPDDARPRPDSTFWHVSPSPVTILLSMAFPSDRLRRLGATIRAWLYAGGNRRDRWQHPERVIRALAITPGDRVADLGSGSGYFTLRLARAVGPAGLVYAVDADEPLLEHVAGVAREEGLTNVRTVPVTPRGLQLPEPVDLLFVSATFHHLPDQAAYFAGAAPLLRPEGRVAILESRGEGLLRRFFGHATPPARARAQMADAGYELIAEHDVVTGHWFAIFRLARR